ncbi:hypothetical protein C8J57DRAFT_1263004 [Mycena rebaudengoi]|nr:hypothetical protein C8J57DRAFT_1263004 [Mycena rebaudengoi]
MRTKFALISVILSALLVSQLVGAVPRKIDCSRVRCAAVKCAGGFISVMRPGECCPTCKPRLRPKPKPDCSAVLCFDWLFEGDVMGKADWLGRSACPYIGAWLVTTVDSFSTTLISIELRLPPLACNLKATATAHLLHDEDRFFSSAHVKFGSRFRPYQGALKKQGMKEWGLLKWGCSFGSSQCTLQDSQIAYDLSRPSHQEGSVRRNTPGYQRRRIDSDMRAE